MKLAAAALTAALALAVQDPEELSFTVLAGFTYTEGMPLPQEVLAYDEKVVTISGFMQREFPGGGPVNLLPRYPTDKAENMIHVSQPNPQQMPMTNSGSPLPKMSVGMAVSLAGMESSKYLFF